MALCSRLKGNGTPCRSMAVRGFVSCFFHLTDEEYAQLKKNQEVQFDVAAELRRQLKIVRNAKGNPLNKAQLILDIVKILKDLEGPKTVPAKPEAEEKKKPTPREILLGK